MSENITIQENGVAKTVTVDKLNTKLVETGDCNWVPEDAFKVGTLKVWRNGTFNASDFGVYGFDKVIVVSGSRGGDAAKMQGGAHIGEIRPEAPAIKEGGKAVKLYGVHHVSVNKTDESRLIMTPESLLTVDDISINKTGTYRAYDYGKYGFDEVTVNIPDSGGGGGQSTKPDAIRITRNPTKTKYVDEETINYSGIVVKAYKNGSIWANNDYPNGIIPFNELIFPVVKSSLVGTSVIYTNGEIIAMRVDYVDVPTYIEYYHRTEILHHSLQVLGYLNNGLIPVSTGGWKNAEFLYTKYNDVTYMAMLTDVYPSDSMCNLYNLVAAYGEIPIVGRYSGTLSAMHNTFKKCPWDSLTEVPESTISPDGKYIPNLNLIQQPATQHIPVQWKRAIDGTLLSTSFNITVTDAN